VRLVALFLVFCKFFNHQKKMIVFVMFLVVKFDDLMECVA